MANPSKKITKYRCHQQYHPSWYGKSRCYNLAKPSRAHLSTGRIHHGGSLDTMQMLYSTLHINVSENLQASALFSGEDLSALNLVRCAYLVTLLAFVHHGVVGVGDLYSSYTLSRTRGRGRPGTASSSGAPNNSISYGGGSPWTGLL